MSSRDYYDILGVSRQAGPEEIKKAYRRLAIKHHPDRNPDDRKAEERFKEINEAYAVLSDPEKRRNYDNFGHADFQAHYTRDDIFRNFDIGDMFKEFGFGTEDIFSEIFGGRRQSRWGPYGRSARTSGDFGDFFGGFGQRPRPQPRRGPDLTCDLQLTLAEAVFGTERTVAFNTPEGVSKVSVQVPPGIEPGKKLRLAGRGQPSPEGGPPGDLLINVHVAPDPRFWREGSDLVREVEVRPSQALLGTTLEVETLEGKRLSLKIPAGTASHKRLRVKGFGVPRFKGSGRGDLYVRVMVRLPEELTARQKELLKALAEEGL